MSGITVCDICVANAKREHPALQSMSSILGALDSSALAVNKIEVKIQAPGGSVHANRGDLCDKHKDELTKALTKMGLVLRAERG